MIFAGQTSATGGHFDRLFPFDLNTNDKSIVLVSIECALVENKSISLCLSTYSLLLLSYRSYFSRHFNKKIPVTLFLNFALSYEVNLISFISDTKYALVRFIL